MVEQLMSLHRCADCPVRCHSLSHPHSFLSRVHRWHTTWWPGWRIYQSELRARGAAARARA